MMRRPLFGCLLLFFASGTSFAQEVQDDAHVDLESIISVLRSMRDKHTSHEASMLARAQQDFRAAAANNQTAIAFYLQALKTNDQATYDRVQPLAKFEVVQSAARLHLNYLLLTLRRAQDAPTKELEPALLAHLAAVAEASANDIVVQARREKEQERRTREQELRRSGHTPMQRNISDRDAGREPLFSEQNLMKQGGNASVFVQWYGIGKALQDAKDWEMAPGNVDRIHEATLLPYWREIKSARALSYWDAKIQQAAAVAAEGKNQAKIDRFNRVEHPTLLWQRAREMMRLGMKNRGTRAMFDLIRTYPDHPSLLNWLSEMEGILGIAEPVEETAPAAPFGGGGRRSRPPRDQGAN